jgi:phenylacetic acid degradation operon negative regulatory protein
MSNEHQQMSSQSWATKAVQILVPYGTRICLASEQCQEDCLLMTAKTKEWLYLLLWATETIGRPTFRNLTESYEGWASRTGLLRQFHRLERERLLESHEDPLHYRVYCLTESGQRAALGGREPATCWARRWDGQWRMVIFDLPEAKNKLRVRLRRFLRELHFGYLQNSVWVSPDSLEHWTESLHGYAEDVESLIFLEARPCGGEPNAAIALGAWDFDRINTIYREYMEVLGQLGELTAKPLVSPQRLESWLKRERTMWFEAMSVDPLLPESLLPSGYLGKKAWQLRGQIRRTLASRIASQ